jgi:hypothetical protein
MEYYTAVKCPCGHPACEDWHITGVAQTIGVRFTFYQAHAVAEFLNAKEEAEADFAATEELRV